MGYPKRIVCLANSRKNSGRCVAGIEFSQESHFGGWVRPVSNRPTQEICIEERRYENGEDPKLMDVITIQMIGHVPHAHQQENHLIDADNYWIKEGSIAWNDLNAATEQYNGVLWVDGHHSSNGLNDRIPENCTLTLTNSLTFQEVGDLSITVRPEGPYHRRKVRAVFSLGQKKYILAVTDPIVETKYLQGADGEYAIGRSRLCISIGEPFQGYCYKLVAGIITP
jgi:hypothetical protein